MRNLKALREEVRNHIDVRFKELRDQALIYFDKLEMQIEKIDLADMTHALYVAEVTELDPSKEKPFYCNTKALNHPTSCPCIHQQKS